MAEIEPSGPRWRALPPPGDGAAARRAEAVRTLERLLAPTPREARGPVVFVHPGPQRPADDALVIERTPAAIRALKDEGIIGVT